MKVRCIDPDCHGCLTFGKEYEVIEEIVNRYYIVDDEDKIHGDLSGSGWSKDRFEVVEEEPEWKPTHVVINKDDVEGMMLYPNDNNCSVVYEDADNICCIVCEDGLCRLTPMYNLKPISTEWEPMVRFKK